MLRIIAGELGGRRLRAPAGLSTRPTADRVRQALFNILLEPPPGSAALDLYAGSGALGIEALSRGCERALFVDRDPHALRTLHQNLGDLGLAGRTATLQLEVPRALERLLRRPGELLAGAPPFGWIFADPPYKSGELPPLLELIGANAARLLLADGVVVVEHAARDAAMERERFGALIRSSTRRYGDTALSFFTVSPSPPSPPSGPTRAEDRMP